MMQYTQTYMCDRSGECNEAGRTSCFATTLAAPDGAGPARFGCSRMQLAFAGCDPKQSRLNRFNHQASRAPAIIARAPTTPMGSTYLRQRTAAGQKSSPARLL